MVSVITPVYNSARTLQDTIDSVKAQTFTSWELILVDDCSRDNSREIAQKNVAEDERIRLIELEQNSGPAVSRNKAIEAAWGRYIAFLDSDDRWLPQKLEKQVAFMQEHQLVLSHTAYKVCDADGKLTGRVIQPPRIVGYTEMLNFNHIGCLTAMYDSKEIGKVYMPVIQKRQDYALWLRILRPGYKAKAIQEPLAIYRTGAKSLSSNKFDTVSYNWKVLRELEGLSIPMAAYHFLNYAIIGLKKYYLNKY